MSGFFQQYKTLLRTYFLIKVRVRASLIQEIITPIYFVGILAIIRVSLKVDTLPEVTKYPSYEVQNLTSNVDWSKPLYVTPDNAFVRSLANNTVEILSGVAGLSYTPAIKYFSSVNEMKETQNVSAGIIFQYDSSNNYSYAIRLPFTKIPDTTVPYKGRDQCRSGVGNDNSMSNCAANAYLQEGFVMLQMAIDTALLRHFTSSQVTIPDVSVEMMPKSSYQPDTSYIQTISAIYFVMAYAPFISFLCALLVVEKEKKIKEGMQMMGLNDLAHSMAIFTLYLVLLAMITGVVCAIAAASNFFTKSNFFIFYIILLFYGLSLISLAYLIAPFFNKANTAGGVSSLGTMAISCLYLIVSLTKNVSSTGQITYIVPPVARGFMCLLSPVSVALALDQGVYLDVTVGMTFSTLGDGEFPLYIPLVMLLVDTVLYLALARYLENVLPGMYGARQKPWFLFSKSYWFGVDSTHRLLNNPLDLTDDDNVEDVTSDIREKTGLRIYNVYKEFKKKDETIKAVNGLSLEMYEGQITCLLGHNGAGKTTLVNMLSGLMRPTRGSATVLGYDISNTEEVQKLRTMTGVCPQHNILFDPLNCEEHLQLYATLKGVRPEAIKREVDAALDHVGLSDQKYKHSKNLSGGQKRKLCVAIAIIGDPKIIFLDEPTAGMDPYSRRHLWSILKEKKKGRIILLTTHFMDEADILADRKAIISKGRLRCCGSSLFLKTKFGIGYHLDMVVDPVCDRESVKDFVIGAVPGAELQRSHGKEVSFTLPLEQVSHFPELFAEMEKSSTSVSTKAEALGIKSYGVSMTSLEEVFLKLEDDDSVSNLQEVLGMTPTAKSGPADSLSSNLSSHTVELPDIHTSEEYLNVPRTLEGIKRRQFWALCRLKYLKLIRNKGLLFINLLVPVILVVVGLVVSKLSGNSDVSNSDPVALSMATSVSYYAGKSGTTTSPGILLKDFAGTGYSQNWSSWIQNTYRNSSYNEVTDLLNIAPHFLGVEINNLDATGTSPNQVLNSNWTFLYNTTAAHSVPVLANLLSNGLVNEYANLQGLNASTKIKSYSKPWPEVKKLSYNQAAFSSVILLGVGLLVVAPGFAVDLVMDREKKARCQLRVSGITQTIYWTSNFFTDIIKFSIPAVLIIIIGLAMQLDSLKNAGAVLSLILIFVTYIPTLTLFSYMFSFAFEKFETCQNFLTTIFFFLGFIPNISVSLVDLITGIKTARIIHTVLCVLDTPYLAFGGFYYIDRIHRVSKLSNTDPKFSDYFKWDNNIPITYIMPFFHFAIYYFLIRVLDIRATGGDISDATNCLGGNRVSEKQQWRINSDIIEGEDEDVAEERRRVYSMHQNPSDNPPVTLVEGLRKEFVKDDKTRCCGRGEKCQKVEGKLYPAVRNASFAVNTGEVLGLLGPNGAGKSTTLNMVIAETSPTKGNVMIAGHNIRSAASEAYTAMGYCPQHDALWDMLSQREHLEVYAAIQGIAKNRIKEVVDWFEDSLKIKEHSKKHAKSLSGGTKRKLSYSISMLGSPKVVLLDEPSTGMDPQSKRFLWDTISMSFSGTERGAILTTHYMEEADALCTRIAIMVNGAIECIGASQHLKNKYGSGYSLEVKLQYRSGMKDEEVEEKMAALDAYIKQMFPNAVQSEKFDERAQYKVPKCDVRSLALTFKALEEGKVSHHLEEYSFSQSTLEQVFIDFAKKQKDEGNEEDDDITPPMSSANNTPIHASVNNTPAHASVNNTNAHASVNNTTAFAFSIPLQNVQQSEVTPL